MLCYSHVLVRHVCEMIADNDPTLLGRLGHDQICCKVGTKMIPWQLTAIQRLLLCPYRIDFRESTFMGLS